MRGRNYVYAVERAAVVATLDGVQHADDADLRIHAAMRYRVGRRHADGFAYAYWADEHGPGIAPYGAIMPPRSGWRWRGRVTGELRLEPAHYGTPRTRPVDCALPPQVERDLVVRARAREGRPFVAGLPVPAEVDDCGMRSPPSFFGDSGFARGPPRRAVRAAAPPPRRDPDRRQPHQPRGRRQLDGPPARAASGSTASVRASRRRA